MNITKVGIFEIFWSHTYVIVASLFGETVGKESRILTGQVMICAMVRNFENVAENYFAVGGSMLEAPSAESSRLSKRMRTFMAAQLRYGNGMTSLDCTIRNISENGARLQVSNAVPLPDQFELYIPQRNLRLRVHLCWRVEDFCGVTFLEGKEKLPSALEKLSIGNEATSEIQPKV